MKRSQKNALEALVDSCSVEELIHQLEQMRGDVQRPGQRCEDFPCCGHAGDPGGCVSEVKRICKDCGKTFLADSLTWDYCYACGSKPRAPELEKVEDGLCPSCEATGELYVVARFKGKQEPACSCCHREWHEDSIRYAQEFD